MKGKDRTDQRGSNPSHSPLYPDGRKGLGYGVLEPTGFNATRQSQVSYPYLDPDPYEDDELDDVLDDDELDVFVKKINGDLHPTDFMAGNKTDRAYFVGGNTRGLSGVIESGIPVATNSIVPFPGWSKKVQAVSGGYTTQPAYDERSFKRTGTLQGYAHRPPRPAVYDPDDEIVAFTLHDILDDDELILAKTRAIQDRIDKLNRQGNDV